MSYFHKHLIAILQIKFDRYEPSEVKSFICSMEEHVAAVTPNLGRNTYTNVYLCSNVTWESGIRDHFEPHLT